MPRERIKTTPGASGYAILVPTGEIFSDSLPSNRYLCQDGGPGYHKDQPFYTESRERSGGLMNGVAASWEHFHHPVDRYSFGVDPDMSFSSDSLDVLGMRVLAETNPSSPIVDIPTFALEFREVPRILQAKGLDWFQKYHSLNLNYKFGITPFVKDLVDMLTLQSDIDRRVKYLNDMASGSATRKVKLKTSKWSTRENVVLNTSGGVTITATEVVRHEVEQWGYTYWYPSVDFPRLQSEIHLQALRAVAGLTVDFSTAWNAIPWSWMADWCGNFGDYLLANRNIVDAYHDDVYICTHHRTNLSLENIVVSRPTVKFTPYTFTGVSKRRQLVSPIIAAKMPFTDPSQLSVLTSLYLRHK